MHVASGTGKPNDARVTLLDQLELRYFKAINKKHKTILQTELLRCFPRRCKGHQSP